MAESNRVPAKLLASLLACVRAPQGFEAYAATPPLPVHEDEECRACFTPCRVGDKAYHVLVRRVGTKFAGRRSIRVHASCPLDYCGLDCPKCGGDDTLGAVGNRPLKEGEAADVRCSACGFVDAQVVREADGGLYLTTT